MVNKLMYIPIMINKITPLVGNKDFNKKYAKFSSKPLRNECYLQFYVFSFCFKCIFISSFFLFVFGHPVDSELSISSLLLGTARLST